MKRALLISCFEEWYKNRLEPISEILSYQGYSVKCVLSDYNHIGKRYSAKKEDACDYIHVPSYKSNISIWRIRSHLAFGKKVGVVIEEYKPVFIYILLPPNITARYCIKYKKRNPNIKLVVDIIDLWPESMPLGELKNTLPARIWKKWRDNAIVKADYVFTECKLYQQSLSYVLDVTKTSTLYLFKNQTEEEKICVTSIINQKKTDDVIKFAYLGSMNNIIDIKGICGVIQNFINVGKTCELYAIGDGESREEFEEAVKKTGCKAFFYGRIFDEEEKIRILAPCDFAFNMMKEEIVVGLTIKSIDYLSYGLPLINNVKGDTWDYVSKNKLGINISKELCIADIDIPLHSNVLAFFESNFTVRAFVNSINRAIRKLF